MYITSILQKLHHSHNSVQCELLGRVGQSLMGTGREDSGSKTGARKDVAMISKSQVKVFLARGLSASFLRFRSDRP